MNSFSIEINKSFTIPQTNKLVAQEAGSSPQPAKRFLLTLPPHSIHAWDEIHGCI